MRTQTGLSRLVLAVGFSVGSLLGSAGLAAAEVDAVRQVWQIDQRSKD